MNDVPDEVLLPLNERLADWADFDVAAFFLGKALGVTPAEQSWGEAKGLFWGALPNGLLLMNMLTYLTDIGVLEMCEDSGQYRWRSETD